MSIQQSINQAISGSLYLLGQSTLFRTLKEERDLKVQKDRLEKETKLNSQIDKGINTPQPQEQEVRNEPVLPVKQDISEDTSLAEKGDPSRDFEHLSQIEEFYLKHYLQRRVAEAAKAKEKSEEFRKMILQGVYVKGDGLDDK